MLIPAARSAQSAITPTHRTSVKSAGLAAFHALMKTIAKSVIMVLLYSLVNAPSAKIRLWDASCAMIYPPVRNASMGIILMDWSVLCVFLLWRGAWHAIQALIAHYVVFSINSTPSPDRANSAHHCTLIAKSVTIHNAWNANPDHFCQWAAPAWDARL